MILDVQDKSVSAKMGEYLATAKVTTCEDGVKGWAVHAWIGDRQMVSAWCQLDHTDAVRACRLLVRWLANRPKFRGDLCKAD